MKEFLKEKIELNYKNYCDLEKIIEQKKIDLRETKERFSKELEDGVKNDDVSKVEERIKYYQDFYIDYTLLVNEHKIIFNKLFFTIEFYKELNYDGLSEEIVEFYEKNRMFAPREIFVIKDGNVSEREEGLLEKERKNFLESDFYKTIISKT